MSYMSVCAAESLSVEFTCSVLVVADQLLITRLKEICEVAVTENCEPAVSSSFQKISVHIMPGLLCILEKKKENLEALG